MDPRRAKHRWRVSDNGDMRTVGVEEELLLLDAGSGRPTPGFAELQAEVAARGLPPVEHELKQEQAEIASAPHEDIASIIADLSSRRQTLCEAAGARGIAPAAIATSPVAA